MNNINTEMERGFIQCEKKLKTKTVVSLFVVPKEGFSLQAHWCDHLERVILSQMHGHLDG